MLRLHMIKAIFFDLDGVLTTDVKGSLTTSKNLCTLVPHLSVTDVLASYREDVEPLNLGHKPFSETWDRLCTTFGFSRDEKTLRMALGTVPKNEAMFAIAESLAKNHRVGIITDNCRERMDILTEELSLADIFDPIITSGVVHAAKFDGTTMIFDAALAGAECTAAEALFIDNQEKNLVTPQKMGMKTYWHDDTKNDIAALQRALHELGIMQN
jgi:putative hydrolase of the HAD superfamily